MKVVEGLLTLTFFCLVEAQPGKYIEAFGKVLKKWIY